MGGSTALTAYRSPRNYALVATAQAKEETAVMRDQAKKMSRADIQALKGQGNSQAAQIVRQKADQVHSLHDELKDKNRELEVLRKTAALADRQHKEIEMWKQKADLMKSMEAALKHGASRDDAAALQMQEFELLKTELSEMTVELADLRTMSDMTADDLKSQLTDTKTQLENVQSHSAELISMKESQYNAKLQELEAAAARDKIRVAQAAELEKTAAELHAATQQRDGFESELAVLKLKSKTLEVTSKWQRGAMQVSDDNLHIKLVELEGELKRKDGELGVKDVLLKRNKELISSQNLELEAARARELVLNEMSKTLEKEQAAGQAKDEAITGFKADVAGLKRDMITVKAASKFTSLGEKAKLQKVQAAHAAKVADLTDQIEGLNSAVEQLHADVAKRERMVCTQTAYQKELVGLPMDDAQKAEIAQDINEGLIQVLRDTSNVPWELAKNTCSAMLEIMFERINGAKVLLAINYAVRPGPFWGDNDGGQDRLMLEDSLIALANYEDEAEHGVESIADDRAIIAACDNIYTIAKDGSKDFVVKFFEEFDAEQIHIEAQLQNDGRDKTAWASVKMLAELYQEANRSGVRRAMCRVFRQLSNICNGLHTVLQETSLPIELARDVKERNALDTDTEEEREELHEALELSVALLSHGEQLPPLDLDFMDIEFVEKLLELAETEPTDPFHERIQLLAVEVVLGYNMQFQSNEPTIATHQRERRKSRMFFSDNVVLTALANRDANEQLSEMLLLLANRASDPLAKAAERDGGDDVPKQNSVLKLLGDIFCMEHLADKFFRTQDLALLMRITTRELTDREPEDVGRLQHLHMLVNILKNSSFLSADQTFENTDMEMVVKDIARESNYSNNEIVAATIELAKQAKALLQG